MIQQTNENKNTTLQLIERLASEVVLREGCSLYDIEIVGAGGNKVVRVYIDKVGGVGVDDCANVSRGLNLLLDVEDPIAGAYNLEVSSPGLERSLKKPQHFQSVVGQKIWLKVARPLGEISGNIPDLLKNAKQFNATLIAASENQVTVEVTGNQCSLPFELIDKAKLIFEQVKNEKKQLNKKS